MPGIKIRSRKRRRPSEDSNASKKAVSGKTANPKDNNSRKANHQPPKKRLKIDIEAAKEEVAKQVLLTQDDAVKAAPKATEELEPPAAPRRSPNGYLLPDPLPLGLVLKDLRGQRWSVGKSVGLGGFGEIYSAVSLGERGEGGEYVVKVEPFTNGPLFVEINYYLRSAKKHTVEEYKTGRRMLHLGVPHVEGTGSFVYRNKKFRFLVMPRYGTDLQTLLDESKLTLSHETATDIARQIVDSYQYIHSKGYVHKDVKGSNLLFESDGGHHGATPIKGGCGSSRRVYLVDYGLVSKYKQLGVHKPYVRDERCAHEGTLEYASRDAHLGCVSRRGDIEVLLYNLIDWIGGKLPWDKAVLDKPEVIQEAKIRAFHDVHAFLKDAFANTKEQGCPPQFILDLMLYVQGLKFEEEPDYERVREMLKKNCGKEQQRKRNNYDLSSSADVSLDSSADEVTLSIEVRPKNKQPPPPPPKPVPAAGNKGDQSEPKTPPPQTNKKPVKKRVLRKRNNSGGSNSSGGSLESSGSCVSFETIDERLEGEEEEEEEEDAMLVYERFLSDESARRFNAESEVVIRQTTEASLLNPTPLMLQQIRKIEERKLHPEWHSWHHHHQHHKRRRNRSLCLSKAEVAKKRRKSTSDVIDLNDSASPAKVMTSAENHSSSATIASSVNGPTAAKRRLSTKKSCPELRKCQLTPSPEKSKARFSKPGSAAAGKGATANPKSQSVLKSKAAKLAATEEKKRMLILRRSPRILESSSNSNKVSGKRRRNQRRSSGENGSGGVDRKASFRQNLSDFFANVTRSILRIKG